MITDEAVAEGREIPEDHCVRVQEMGVWITMKEYENVCLQGVDEVPFVDGDLRTAIRRILKKIELEKRKP